MASVKEAFYQEQTRLARESAEKATDVDMKVIWLEIADKYKALAELQVRRKR